MAYAPGGLIEASDLNNFATRIRAVYETGTSDSGYGQTSLSIPTVSVGDSVASTEWVAARNQIAVAIEHQSGLPLPSSVPDPLELELGDPVKVASATNFGPIITQMENNRLLVDPANVAIMVDELQIQRNTPWVGPITVIFSFTATFTNTDQARFFFNSGGQLRFRPSRTGGSATVENNSWTNLLINVGTVVFDHTQTAQNGGGSGGTTSGIGYFDLTDSFQTIFFQDGNPLNVYTVYNNNSFTVKAKREAGAFANGGNGRTLTFQFEFEDLDADTMDGLLEVAIDERKAGGLSPLVISSPSYNDTSP